MKEKAVEAQPREIESEAARLRTEAEASTEGDSFLGRGLGLPGFASSEPGTEAGSSRGEFLKLPVTDQESLSDHGVVGRYIKNIFSKRDLESSGALIDKTKNPYRIIQSLALNLALVSTGLEHRQWLTTAALRKAASELDQVRGESSRALDRAREEVATEVQELKDKLAEAEAAKAKAEEEAEGRTRANRQLKLKLRRAKEAQKAAEDSGSALEKNIADLSRELAELKSEYLQAGNRAVEEYKESDEFRLEVANRAAPAFMLGLQKYREVLSEQLSELDLSGMDALLPLSLPDEAVAEEEEDEEDEDQDAEAPAGDADRVPGAVPEEEGGAEADAPLPDEPVEGVADLSLQVADADADASLQVADAEADAEA